jgi:RNA polymerase sigma factor (sigma-70 family)
MTDCERLLSDYVTQGSDSAFRELVSRYTDFVFATALRLAGGDTHLAQDVAQTVFVDLARNARKLSRQVMLGGWLHRHTCFVASKAMRSERRRQSRERQSVEMKALQDDDSAEELARIAPVLDAAIDLLGEKDRAAILLRFFEKLDFRSVGEALGTNEDTAQKRVSRALEKLHALLRGRGARLSGTVLGTVLAAEAVTAAPAGMAATLAGTALASAGVASGGALLGSKFLGVALLKPAVIAALAVAGLAVPFLIQNRSIERLRHENGLLQQQSEQLAAENERLSNLVFQANSGAGDGTPSSELLRLRGEVGRLRREIKEAEGVRAENNRLRKTMARTVQEQPTLVFQTNGNPVAPLYTRVIKVQPELLVQKMRESLSGAGGDSVQEVTKKFIESKGLEIVPPSSLFFNEREGSIIVRSSMTNLETIETLVQMLSIPPEEGGNGPTP